MHAMEEDDEFQRLMLAKVLLAGYTEIDARGLPLKKYLAKDKEPEARSAIACILRDHQKPLDHDLRDKMAALFDLTPDTYPAIDRKIVFVHRGKGQRQNSLANTAIAWHVRGAITQGSTVTAAIQSATDKFGVDDSTVKKLWGRYRRVFEAIWGPLRRHRRGERGEKKVHEVGELNRLFRAPDAARIVAIVADHLTQPEMAKCLEILRMFPRKKNSPSVLMTRWRFPDYRALQFINYTPMESFAP